MKLQKKHAVAATELVLDCIEDGFMPYDKEEEVLFSKIIGFAQHHNLMEDPDFFIRKLEAFECPTPRKTARLDLDEHDLESIESFTKQLYLNHRGEGDIPSAVSSLIRYLNREFIDV